MAGSNYKKGAARERALAKQLEEEGWTVNRSPQSRSPWDLVAVRPAKLFGGTATGICEVFLVQVKANASGGPYSKFGPSERVELSGAATRAGAKAWLVYWPPHGVQRWIAETEWPTISTDDRE